MLQVLHAVQFFCDPNAGDTSIDRYLTALLAVGSILAIQGALGLLLLYPTGLLQPNVDRLPMPD